MLKSKQIFSFLLSVFLLCGVLNAAPVLAQETNIDTARLYGSDRYATSVAVSKAGWTQASTVIIVTGSDYPDALSASSLSKLNDAPILLAEKNALSSAAYNEIIRLKASQAILVGGTGVIGTGIENQLKGIGVTITRIGGVNRYETSKKAAEKIGVSNGIIIATGLNFPDALSIASIAGIKSIPILLSGKTSLDSSVSAFIKDKIIPVSYVVGGTGVLAPEVASSVPNCKRLGGTDRYATNQIINIEFAGNLNFDTVYLATGNDFPDALSGSALAAKNNAPIFLTDKNSISSGAIELMISKGVKHVVILGGTGAVSKNVEDIVQGKDVAFNSLAKVNTDIGDSEQALVVLADEYGTYKTTYAAYEKINGKWTVISSGNSVIGKCGFSDNRTEGDMTTPTGKYGFPFMFGTASNPGVKYEYRLVTEGDYWVSNTILSEYNVWMHYTGSDPEARLHDYEELWKQPLYKYAAVIDFNYYSNKQMGKGSGIFLHIAPYSGLGTAGCVAMKEAELVGVLKWLDPNKKPVIVMGVKGHI